MISCFSNNTGVADWKFEVGGQNKSPSLRDDTHVDVREGAVALRQLIDYLSSRVGAS
jgi:hypothetical protein